MLLHSNIYRFSEHWIVLPPLLRHMDEFVFFCFRWKLICFFFQFPVNLKMRYYCHLVYDIDKPQPRSGFYNSSQLECNEWLDDELWSFNESFTNYCLCHPIITYKINLEIVNHPLLLLSLGQFWLYNNTV